MKIIHTADIHLGAKMDSVFPKEVSDKRKEELRNTFRKTAEYARSNGVGVIMLSGDIFDSDSPFKKDKEFFYSVVKNYPEIDFLYLKGNHDIAADYSGEVIPNLKTFSNEWTSYTYGNVVISGIEITAENSISLYSALSLEKDNINIVMLHGQVGDTYGKDKINIKKLRDKNIDYLALGHIHKTRLNVKVDDRAVYSYSGCLEGRGFDEAGEHGFVLLDIGEKITQSFIPFAEREIVEADADITGAHEAFGAYRSVKEQISFEKRNIYRINLVGEVEFDVDALAGDVAKYLSSDCFFITVKDRTAKKLDVIAYEKDTSLKGEFVRCVYSNPDYTDDEKKRIIAYGLKALKGGAIE